MLKRHADSHLDHALTPAQVDYVLNLDPGNPDAVHVQTVTLPVELGTVPCALVGPIMGDAPVCENAVTYVVRGNRTGASRTIAGTPRPTRVLTVISGAHAGARGVLFTAFGGPAAPREPFEFSDDDTSDAAIASRRFWADHALLT